MEHLAGDSVSYFIIKAFSVIDGIPTQSVILKFRFRSINHNDIKWVHSKNLKYYHVKYYHFIDTDLIEIYHV